MQSLLKYNTFGIDQSCRKVYEPTTVEELTNILPTLRKEPLLVVGGGSNLLLTKDFNGNVLHPLMKGIEIEELSSDSTKILMRCGAGEVWDEVIAYAVSHGYYGMENMSYIPGNVGASAIQNVGAYGVEAKDVIYRIEAIDISTGENMKFSCADCGYDYRYSKFKDVWKGKYIVTHVTYCLSRIFQPVLDYGNIKKILTEDKGKKLNDITAMDVRDAVIEIRKAKLPDPKEEGNAGSFFMNPIIDREKYEQLVTAYPNIPYYVVGDRFKIPAGWMIEQCGWKGKTLGKAGVHPKQALVLVNKGGAKGEDIVALSDAIRHDVKEKFGIDIKPEVNII